MRGHLGKHALLVRGIAFDRADEVGHEVGAASELDGDPAEAFLHQRAEPDQPVVDRHAPDREQHEYDDENDAFEHDEPPLRPCTFIETDARMERR